MRDRLLSDASEVSLSNLYDYLIKVILIGPSGCGKSSILYRFLNSSYSSRTPTVAVDFASRIIKIGNTRVKLQIWDTAGQERFRSVSRSYYRDSAAGIVIYDITRRESFLELDTFLTDALSLSPSLSLLLVGNKNDLSSGREVTHEEAAFLAKRHRMPYLETSALSGEGIQRIFDTIAQLVVNRIESGDIDPHNSSSGVQWGDARLEPASGLSYRPSFASFTPRKQSSMCRC